MNNKFLLIPMLILLPCLSAMATQTCVPEYPASTPTEDFTDNGDGTVTHDKTGLTWMRCALGQSWDGTTCIGTTKSYKRDDALKATNTLNSSGGYSGQTDWRVPDLLELESIVETKCRTPATNVAVFPKTPDSSIYWSSSMVAGQGPWYVYFTDGQSAYDDEYDPQFDSVIKVGKVRLVRGGHPWFGVSDFQDQTGVTPRAKVTSNPVVMVNIADGTAIGVTKGSYSINGGKFTSQAGAVNPGDQVRLQVTASTKYAMAIHATFKIGDLEKKFTVTTRDKLQFCDPGVPAFTPTSSFSDNGNGTVTHKKTGLTWMRCALGQIRKGSACVGKPEHYAWEGALDAADDLNVNGYANQTDWRVPTKNELESIVELQCQEPAINAAIFPSSYSRAYWSSTPFPINPDFPTWIRSWGVGFFEGGSKALHVDGSGGVRAVRLVRDDQ